MRPLVWAHRGASGYMPENTLLSFQKAIEMHADGIELDIQLSKDGEIVVCHDESIDRTSNGSGYIKDYTLEELKQFNFNKTHPEVGFCEIPTMQEVFDLIKPTDLTINIELKTGIFFYEGIEEKIIRMVKENEMEDRVFYSSFNHMSILKVKELNPHAKTAFLYQDGPIDMPAYAKKHGVDAIHPALYNLQYPNVMKDANKYGLEVNVWIANTKEHILFCLGQGVHAIFTDYPDLALDVLNGNGLSEEFERYINQEIQPWLQDCVNNTTITTEDGLRLNAYYAIHPNEVASVVIVHGFCEFFGKYHELSHLFYSQGYSVFFVELRGHGKSDRTISFQDQRVHVETFHEYVGDVKALIDQVVKKYSKTNKYFLYGHSMGGAVSALLLENNPDMFQCAILASPMLKLELGKVPDWTVGALTMYSRVRENDLEFAPGQHAFTGDYQFESSNAMDRDRYIYQFYQRVNDKSYQTWGSTWGWVKAAIEACEEIQKNVGELKTQTLLCQAGSDTMVDNEGQKEFARNSSLVTMLEFPGAKHELFNATEEIRNKFFQAIIDYYKAFSRT